MANSNLVTVTVPSPNNSGTRAYKVTRITPHCMVGQLTARSCGNLFAKASYQASSNYGIGKDGEVGLYVDESKRSWCSSSADNDNRAITIECASDTKAPYTMNSKVWESLIDLCTDICRRYGKTKLLWLGDKTKTLKYVPKDTEIVLTAHRWFAAKSCPGDWLYTRLGKLADEVNAKLAEKSKEQEDIVVEEPNTAAAVFIDNEEEDRERKIWNFLSAKGLNDYAVAGLMGNLYAESALRPNNLQNSFEKKLGMTDKGYTSAVNDGSYKHFEDDKAGYGLAQWTWLTRKKNLLEYAKSTGKSIDDLQMQLEFLWKEIQGYSNTMKILKTAGTVKAASDIVLTDFEKPADQSDDVKKRRASFGVGYYEKYAGGKATAGTGASSGSTSTSAEKKEEYCIQFGAFILEKGAKLRAETVKAKGLDVTVLHLDGLYKVQTKATYSSMAEAKTARKAAERKGCSVIIKTREV